MKKYYYTVKQFNTNYRNIIGKNVIGFSISKYKMTR